MRAQARSPALAAGARTARGARQNLGRACLSSARSAPRLRLTCVPPAAWRASSTRGTRGTTSRRCRRAISFMMFRCPRPRRAATGARVSQRAPRVLRRLPLTLPPLAAGAAPLHPRVFDIAKQGWFARNRSSLAIVGPLADGHRYLLGVKHLATGWEVGCVARGAAWRVGWGPRHPTTRRCAPCDAAPSPSTQVQPLRRPAGHEAARDGRAAVSLQRGVV